MWQQGVISEDDYRSAAAQPLVLAETDNTKKSSSTTSYFTDALFNEVVKDIMAKAVSYTHLDVYKRQHSMRRERGR